MCWGALPLSFFVGASSSESSEELELDESESDESDSDESELDESESDELSDEESSAWHTACHLLQWNGVTGLH